MLIFYSYKEDTDDATDEDDVLEWKTEDTSEEKPDAETVEKIISQRIGKKGGEETGEYFWMGDLS